MANPISFVLFVSATWKFYYLRILEEEASLIDIFGDEYLEYSKSVKNWIPFMDMALTKKRNS